LAVAERYKDHNFLASGTPIVVTSNPNKIEIADGTVESVSISPTTSPKAPEFNVASEGLGDGKVPFQIQENVMRLVKFLALVAALFP